MGEARLSDLEARLPKQSDDRRPAAPTRGLDSLLTRRTIPHRPGSRRLFAPQSPAIEPRTDVHATAVQTAENQLLGPTESLVFGAVLLVPFMALALFGRRSGSRQDKTRLSYIL